MDAQPAWYLVQSKPGQGFRATEQLQNQGYQCFHPVMTVEKLRRQQRVQVEEPLFPGYLFIRLDTTSDNWSPIRSTRGVSRIVAFNGQPLPVADTLVEDIHQRISQQSPQPVLQAGDRVQVTGGAFVDLDAVFQCFDGDQRAIILLTLLQRRQTVKVPVSQLQKVT